MAQQIVTGALIRKGKLEWTSLRKSKDKTEFLGSSEDDLPPIDPDLADPLLERSAHLKKSFKKGKGLMNLAVPASSALLRVVELPTAEPDEMQGMVDLQVDKYSPFPTESMAISYEVLAKGETNTLVLIVGVQQALIDEMGAPFLKAGIIPHWIDVNVLGWWYLLKDYGDLPDFGNRVVIVKDHDDCHMVVCRDGVPIIFRPLEAIPEHTADEFMNGLIEEVSYTLTALEAEWGEIEVTHLLIWHWDGDGIGMISDEVKSSVGIDVELRKLDILPPLSEGLARRAFWKNEMTLDLASVSWHDAEHYRILKRNALIATGIFLCIWLIGISVLMSQFKGRESKITQLESQVAAVEGPAVEVRELKTKARSFQQYADRTYSALECLREVTSLMPSGVDLTSFVYKKSGTVTLRGVAETANQVYDFSEVLEASGLFAGVKLAPVSTAVRGGQQRQQFSVTIELPGDEDEADES